MMVRQRWLPAVMLVAAGLGGGGDLCAQYAGPSILSRGGNSPGIRGRAPIDFNIYASIRGVYDTGLIAPQLDESGNLSRSAIGGLLVEGGIYGGHNWRRTSLGLDFRTDYRYQPAIPFYNGANSVLSAQVQHRLSRRTSLMVAGAGGTTNRAFGGFLAPTFGSADSIGVPLNELFDVRIYFADIAATLAYQKSARSTFTFGGDAFFVKRRAFSLVNSQGYRANAGWNYRLSARTGIFTNFQFMRFQYPHVYTSSDILSASVGVQRALSRSLHFFGSFGLLSISTGGVGVVQLSPEVAEILGRPTGLVAFEAGDRIPLVVATLSYLQERGRYYVTFSNGVLPGNGIYLTSHRTTFNGGYSYAGFRRLSLGVSGGWTRNGSVILDLQPFQAWQAGGGFSYRMYRSINLMGSVDRRYFYGGTIQGRSGTSISIGLAYSPSRFPISIW